MLPETPTAGSSLTPKTYQQPNTRRQRRMSKPVLSALTSLELSSDLSQLLALGALHFLVEPLFTLNLGLNHALLDCVVD